EAAGAGGNRRQIDGSARAPAEHDIAAPRDLARRRIAVARADNYVGEAVAVDIACAGDAAAAAVICALAVDDESASAGGDGREVDGSPRGPAEHDIAVPCALACRRIAAVRADNQVGEAVAVDVARRSNAGSAAVVLALAVDDEAARSIGDG